MSSRWQVNMTVGVDNYSHLTSRFYKMVLERGYDHSRGNSYSAETIDVSTATFSRGSLEGSGMAGLWDFENSVAYASLGGGKVSVSAWGADVATVERALERMKEYAPEADQKEPDEVDVTFWAMSGNGPESQRRRLHVPDWADITGNYAGPTSEGLSKLLDPEWRPGSRGQLLLWYGVPGTGKTTALRALARSWKDWCDFHYITDPEDFFGNHAAYMMQVLTGEYYSNTERWRLLILEDAGELMAADARVRSGAGLARFLNAVDGLIGQGLRVMILVTTNEELGKLHPAVSRPGRCAARIHFANFDAEEAWAWLDAHGRTPDGDVPRNLADLYGLDESHPLIEVAPVRKVGFA